MHVLQVIFHNRIDFLIIKNSTVHEIMVFNHLPVHYFDMHSLSAFSSYAACHSFLHPVGQAIHNKKGHISISYSINTY
jgi:hypothetical protein